MALSRQASNQSQRSGNNQMMPLMNNQRGNNNNGMLLTANQARKQRRLMNAFRLGGATNANRIRRAQNVGARALGGNQQQRQQMNTQLVGGVSFNISCRNGAFLT
jgi:hypothetical protein